MADPKRERAGLVAEQSAAAAAHARKPSATTRVALRAAQRALIDYDRKQRSPKPASAARRSQETPDSFTGGVTGGIDLNDPATARWIQTVLKNAGFYKGKVDGIWGPMSDAANKAWNAAGRPAAPSAAPVDPARAAAPASPSGGGGGGGPAGPGAGPGPAPAAPIGDFRTRVLAELPSAAAFLDIPELVPILAEFIDKRIPEQEFFARVMATEWWRTTPQKKRSWMGLQTIDPASAQRQVEEQKAKLRQFGYDYALDFSDPALEEWARKTLGGEVPDSAFDGYLKEQAKSLFPTLSGAIDRGVTVRQYADQYVQRAVQRLGISAESINLAEDKWRRALVNIDPKTGDRVAMSLDQWDAELKSNPMYGWDHTTLAREDAARFATELSKVFGKVA